MPLSAVNIPAFHVEHSTSLDQARDLRFERRDPELGGYISDQGHQTGQVLTIQFGGRVIQQQGRSTGPFKFLDLQLRQHQARRDEFLLPAGDAIFGGLIAHQDRDVAPVRAELRCPVTTISRPIGGQCFEEAPVGIPATLVDEGDGLTEERLANSGQRGSDALEVPAALGG